MNSKRRYKEDFYVSTSVIFSVLSNATRMIVRLYTNSSFVVDLFVDSWAELAPLLWPHNWCRDHLLYRRCCFGKTKTT